ncbi:MAG: type II secretion system F family protein [Coriobacteriales bacterium]
MTARQRLDAAERSMRELLNRLPPVRHALQRARGQRLRMQLRQSLPQALRMLCIALDSGNSLVKALEYAAHNSSGAMARELRHALWDMRAGLSFGEAMEGLRQRTGGSEFACLAVAMEVQHRCGGSISAVLQGVSSVLQQNAELEEELATKTTQAQLSAKVVALMPLAVLALLSLVSPGYLGRFFESPVGVALLVMAVVLELVGVVLVRQSLDIGLEEL